MKKLLLSILLVFVSTITVMAICPTALAVTTINSTCGSPNGVINIGAVTSGTPPFTYSVNGSAFTTTTNYPGLVAGTYTVIVKDASACTFTTTANITNIPGPTAMAVTTNNSTCSIANGTINIGAVTGGTFPYTYSFNGSAFTSTMTYTGLAAGTYTITVKDGNGCLFTTSATIVNSSGPTALMINVNNTTCGNTNGVIHIVIPTGGTAPYTYSVNGSAFTSTTTYSGFSAGTYNVSVKDANGCVFTTTATVGNTPLPTATISQAGNILSCSPSATTYQWYLNSVLISGATSQTFPITTNGNYTVVITDVSGCTATSSVYSAIYSGIEEHLSIKYDVQVYPNPFSDNTTFIIQSEKSGETYSFEIYDLLGKKIKVINEIKSKQFTISRSGIQNGTYFYKIYIAESIIKTGELIIK